MFTLEKKEKNELVEWGKAIIFGIALAWGIKYFLFTPISVQGASMMPTFEDGERVMVNKIEPKLSDYERFDVIVFEAKKDTNYIKRVIGVPGDRIAYENDQLYINDKKYEEPYLDAYKKALKDSGTLTEDFTLEAYTGESVVPKGYLFVLGDNRRISRDSRDPNVGFVPIDKVLGTVNFVIWPLNHFELVGDKE